MDPDKQREIASLGGKAAHAKGTAHVFSTEEARIAGRKGGIAAQHAAFMRGQDRDGTSTETQDSEPEQG